MALSRSRVVATSIPTVVLALGVGSTAVRTPEADARVSISALTVVDGSVLTSHGGADFAPAREGDVMVAGDTIRTGASAAAEITYFEGSSVRLEANAEMIVESLRTSGGDAGRRSDARGTSSRRFSAEALATKGAVMRDSLGAGIEVT